MPCFWSQIQWGDYKPPSNEHVIVTRALTKIARFKYQSGGYEKVPRWLLRFTLHFLAQSPLPPTSVVINCLSIVALDLGYDSSNIVISDERCVHILQIPALLTKN